MRWLSHCDHNPAPARLNVIHRPSEVHPTDPRAGIPEGCFRTHARVVANPLFATKPLKQRSFWSDFASR